MSYIVEQKIKGRVYLYKAESYWDKDKQQPRQKRTYIGPKEENPKKTSIKKEIRSVITRNLGNIKLLQTAADTCGLTKVLSGIFPDCYKEILALSFYDIMEGAASFKFPYWLIEQYLPGVKKMHSSDISNLFDTIGSRQKERMDFFRKWTKHIKPDGGIYYDITSVSSYSTNIDFIEWGYNRDGENLPQLNMGLVCCQKQSLPFFYSIFQGSISDVSTMKNHIQYLNILKLKNVLHIQDKGFCSVANILDMHKNKMQFIQPLSFSWKKVKELIRKNKEILHQSENTFQYNEEILSHALSSIVLEGVKFDVHLYLNEKAEIDQKHLFMSKLFETEKIFKQTSFATQTDFDKYINDNITEKLRKYFSWNKQTKQVQRNQDAINEYLAYLGYFVFATNKKNLDKTSALDMYRNKDVIEKMYDITKNEMDGNRLRVHSRVNTEGRLFIKFITLIIYLKLSRIMKDYDLFKKFSLREVLLELRKIKITHIDNHEPIISEISKKQRELIQIFDLVIDHSY
jgi:transposase